MKKFGAGLSREQMEFARRVERTGLASISQVVKAFERGEEQRIAAWRKALGERYDLIAGF